MEDAWYLTGAACSPTTRHAGRRRGLHPDAEPSQRAKALCYLDETAGLARAREEIAAAHSCRT